MLTYEFYTSSVKILILVIKSNSDIFPLTSNNNNVRSIYNRVNKFKNRVNYVAIIRDLYAVSRIHCLLWAINVIWRSI